MFGKRKNEICVEAKQVPDIFEDSKFQLVEIKDDIIISKIKSAVPELAEIVTDLSTGVCGKQLVNAGVYQVILPSGAKLVNSQDMQGAVRGFFRNGKGIGGQANFIAADSMVDKIAAVNMMNAITGTAALIVGQYYMKQINSELIAMKENLSRIGNFQMAEYKSRVLTLVGQVRRISDYKTEILEVQTLRKEETLRLQGIEKTCMELLIQANETISNLIKKECVSFDKYEKIMVEVSAYHMYQVGLTEILYIIADLNYTLHLGALSKQYCYSMYSDLYNATNKIKNDLIRWHEVHRKKFCIDVDFARMERKGIDAIIHKPFGLINDNFNYKNIDKNTVLNIRQQKNMPIVDRTLDMKDRFNEDVCIVVKDGKFYYKTESL